MDNNNATINISQFSQNASHYKRFLKRLPSDSDVQFISMAFHAVARNNKNLTPTQLLDLAIFKLSSKHPHTIQYLNSHKDEALEFSTYVLEKITLPKKTQRLIKQKQIEIYVNKESMAKKAPTPKQLQFLAELGFKGQVRTRLEAYEAITRLKGEQNER